MRLIRTPSAATRRKDRQRLSHTSVLAFIFCIAFVRCGAAVVKIAATPVQLNTSDPTNYWFGFESAAPLGSDVDVVAIHDDFYGVPWSFFSGSASVLPASWEARLNDTLAFVAAWGKPVFLTFQMLTGPLRTCPAANASDGWTGAPVVSPFSGCGAAGCYDFDPASNPAAGGVIASFVRYASFMTATFARRSPLGLTAVNFAPEINLGARLCSPAWWNGTVAFANTVYAAVKDVLASMGQPSVPVFPSIQMDVVMGLQSSPNQPCMGLQGSTAPSPAIAACIADGLQLVAPLSRDWFAVSTYPHNQMAGFPVQGPHWQPWYFPAVLQQLSAKDRATFAVAETGFISNFIVVNFANGSVGASTAVLGAHGLAATASAVSTLGGIRRDARVSPSAREGESDPTPICETLLNASTADAADWLQYVIAQAVNGSWPLLTWWSDVDLLWGGAMDSCPCTAAPAFESSCIFVSAYRQIEAAAGGASAAWMGELQAKAFGSMGIRDVTGAPKEPLYSMLQAARSL